MGISVFLTFSKRVDVNDGILVYVLDLYGKKAFYPSEYRISVKEWNENTHSIITGDDAVRNVELVKIRNRVGWEIAKLKKIASKFESQCGTLIAGDVFSEFENQRSAVILENFANSLSHVLDNNHQIRTSETYLTATHNFISFAKDKSIRLYEITSDLIEEYETFLQVRGLTANTTSFYMRVLRSIYNQGVKRHLIENHSPFMNVYTGIAATAKRALTIGKIQKIKNLNLSGRKNLEYARDMFLLSFYLRGMSFVDMAYLKKCDLKHGYITYFRQKTRQRICVRWESEIQEIISKYDSDPVFMLPVLKSEMTDLRNGYKMASKRINRNLCTIGKLAGISQPLTMYVARHSWASIAVEKGIPISVISEGLGHRDVKTTKIYISGFNKSALDKANDKIMAAIR